MSTAEKDAAKPKSALEPRLIRRDGLAEFEERIRKAIAYRAYSLYESRGRDGGHDLEDWFAAERELVKPSSVEIAEVEGEIRLRAQVDGFVASEIEIGIAPRRLVVWGEKARAEVPDTVRLFDEIDLPAPIDADRAAAAVSAGVLEFHAPKGRADGT